MVCGALIMPCDLAGLNLKTRRNGLCRVANCLVLFKMFFIRWLLLV